MTEPRIAIVGAGPTGLEAALAAAEAGMPFTVYEAAARAGGHVRQWGHVRLFTPWDMNVSPRAAAALDAAGLDVPSGAECPTGAQLADRLLQPIADLPTVSGSVRYGTRVVDVSRDGYLKSDEIGTGRRADRPFRLVVSEEGKERVETADVVLDCSGTYAFPNATGVGGIHAPGERASGDRITRLLPDFGAAPADWLGKRTLVVGAGHSAQTAAVALAELVAEHPGTEVVWAIRNDDPCFGVVDDDPLPEREALGRAALRLTAADGPFDVRTGVVIEAFDPSDGGVRVALRAADGTTEWVEVDRVVSLTGSVGDAAIFRQLQVHECYATTGPMKLAAALLSSGSADCLTETSHGADTLRNPEPGFFILGEKSYGRNTNFLMRIGWEQVADAFSLVAADRQAAGVA